MKLIDLLVQELPKRGGWPEGCSLVVKNKGEEYLRFGFNGMDLNCAPAIKFYGSGAVKKEEYEAALAASTQVEWDGCSLPPVGCVCEYLVRQAANKFWQSCTIIAVGKENLIAEVNGEEVVFFAPQIEFRAIRTEAERKREEAGLAIYHAINWNAEGELVSDSRMEDYQKAYDAIAAGKIPGIKLSD